jgi:glucose/arabinose dehydrogenase
MMKNKFVVKPLRLSFAALSAGILSFGQTQTPITDPLPAPPQSAVTVGLKEVASGFVVPVWGAFPPGDDDHLYVVDAVGKIWVVNVSDENAPGSRLFLDMSSQIVPLGVFKGYDERGLLGMAFHPDFRHNGLFYTFSSQPVKGTADFSTLPAGISANCQSVITEWRVMMKRDHDHGHDGDHDQDRDHDSEHGRDIDIDDDNLTVDMSSARELLRVDKPQFNHNGGTLVFGPDHMLYVSLGDGGAANDVGDGHVAPGGNAQTLTPNNLLGKILRIDPLGHNSANGKYGIPHDNPFARNGKGPAEVWAYGFRNPFRMSFDSKTGMLWAADVGQNQIEEVDIVEKGRNYGWPVKEGTFLFNAKDGTVYANSPGSPAGLIDPIAQYDHSDAGATARIATVGGFVYRGREVPALRGHYVFGDYSSKFLVPDGHLFFLTGADRHPEYLQIQGQSSLGWAVQGFGEDARGEVYLLGNTTGGFVGTTGKVLKLTKGN